MTAISRTSGEHVAQPGGDERRQEKQEHSRRKTRCALAERSADAPLPSGLFVSQADGTKSRGDERPPSRTGGAKLGSEALIVDSGKD
jgi:hypothetical protein